MENPFAVKFTPTQNPLEDERKRYGAIDSAYSSAIGSQATFPQLQDKYANKYNVPDLQQKAQFQNEQAQQVGDSIAGVAQNFGSTSSNSTLTQGQRDRAIQARQQPLLNSYNTLASTAAKTNSALGTAQTNQNQAVSMEQAQQAKELTPFLQQYSNEQILGAMAQTSWTTENQMELNRLIQNAQTGVALSEGEKNRANQLAIAEKGFENALKLQKGQQSAQPSYVSVGEGSAVFDPSTGKMLYKNPKTYQDSVGGGTYNPNLSSSPAPLTAQQLAQKYTWMTGK